MGEDRKRGHREGCDMQLNRERCEYVATWALSGPVSKFLVDMCHRSDLCVMNT